MHDETDNKSAIKKSNAKSKPDPKSTVPDKTEITQKNEVFESKTTVEKSSKDKAVTKPANPNVPEPENYEPILSFPKAADEPTVQTPSIVDSLFQAISKDPKPKREKPALDTQKSTEPKSTFDDLFKFPQRPEVVKTSDDEEEEPRFVNYDPPAAFEPYCVKKPEKLKGFASVLAARKNSEAKKEEPKVEEIVEDEPVQETFKSESIIPESIRSEPKKQEAREVPKKPETQKDESKKQETLKDEPRKQESLKVESKIAESITPEPKKQELPKKQEAPKEVLIKQEPEKVESKSSEPPKDASKRQVKKKQGYELPEIPDYDHPDLEKYEANDYDPRKHDHTKELPQKIETFKTEAKIEEPPKSDPKTRDAPKATQQEPPKEDPKKKKQDTLKTESKAPEEMSKKQEAPKEEPKKQETFKSEAKIQEQRESEAPGQASFKAKQKVDPPKPKVVEDIEMEQTIKNKKKIQPKHEEAENEQLSVKTPKKSMPRTEEAAEQMSITIKQEQEHPAGPIYEEVDEREEVHEEPFVAKIIRSRPVIETAGEGGSKRGDSVKILHVPEDGMVIEEAEVREKKVQEQIVRKIEPIYKKEDPPKKPEEQSKKIEPINPVEDRYESVVVFAPSASPEKEVAPVVPKPEPKVNRPRKPKTKYNPDTNVFEVIDDEFYDYPESVVVPEVIPERPASPVKNLVSEITVPEAPVVEVEKKPTIVDSLFQAIEKEPKPKRERPALDTQKSTEPKTTFDDLFKFPQRPEVERNSDDDDEEPRLINYDPPAAFEPYCVRKPNQPKGVVIEPPKKVEIKIPEQMKCIPSLDQPFREELCLPPPKIPAPIPVVSELDRKLETIVEEKPKSEDQVISGMLNS